MHTTSDNADVFLGTLSTGESVPLAQGDRRRHVYIIGQTGTGKTGLLLNLMASDHVSGRGFCFIDPHGDASEHIASATPRHRMHDTIYLDPTDPTHTFSYNPLSGVPEAARATAAANIVSAFKNIWRDSWGPRLEYILTNSLRLLLDAHDQTLLALPRLLIDNQFREWLIRRCSDPVVRSFWQTEYAAYDTRFRNEAIAPIQNKVGVLLGNPFLRAILCQNASTLDIPRIMNEGQALILNLSKGGLGTEPAHLIGALLITAFSQAAEARRRMPEQERRDFTLYVDEFANFATDSFATILSEARKWRLSLVAASQHITQLSEPLRHAVFGNCGTLIAFRVSALDAAILAGEIGMADLGPLAQTDNFNAWAKVMRDGTPTEPRLILMHAPPPPGARFAKVLAHARARHMTPRRPVEERIATFFPKALAKRTRKRPRRDPDRA